MNERQFIHSLRQLKIMNQRTRRDFSGVVDSLSQQRIDTLVSEGVPPGEAFPQTWEVAKREYPGYTGNSDIPF